MSSGDVLTILRDAIIKNKPVSLDGNQLTIGDDKFAADMDTYYRSQKGTGPYYTLVQVWQLYVNRNLAHGKYITEVGNKSVSFVDRKDLLGYLSGEKATSIAIKEPIAPVTSAASTTSNAAAAAAASAASAAAAAAASAAAASAAANNVASSSSNAMQLDDTATSAYPTTTTTTTTIPISSSTTTTTTANDNNNTNTDIKRRIDDSTDSIPPTKKSKPTDDPLSLSTLEVLKTERNFRNRKTILRIPRDRATFDSLKNDAERLHTLEKIRNELAVKAIAEAELRAAPTAYDRYAVKEDQFWKERISDAQEFDIDTTGTFAASVGAIKGLADVAKPVGNDRTKNNNNNNNNNNQNNEPSGANLQTNAKNSNGSETTNAARHQQPVDDKLAKRHAANERELMPIIIVPTAGGVISYQNVKDFLENGQYKPAVKTARDVHASSLIIKHNDVKFEICSTEEACALKDPEWKRRVVAVIVQGQAWQFKGWKLSDPTLLFSQVQGVLFMIDDEKPPPATLGWRVRKVNLSRSRRHLDKARCEEFWAELIKWCELVFFDHDGGVDDYVALLLLLSRTKGVAKDRATLDLIGVSITDADTFAEPASKATCSILDFTNNSHVPVAIATVPGKANHEFPHDWRLDSYKVEAFPILHQKKFSPKASVLKSTTGQQLMLDSLKTHKHVTLVMTGPLTNLAWCLKQDASIVANIDEVVLMGGAVDVAGNVQQQFVKKGETHDGSAEWNIFWDPEAAKVVLEEHSQLRIRMFSLDATNHVPITDEFLYAFGAQYDHPLSALAGTIYALVANHILRTELNYFAWDVLTAAYMVEPELFRFDERRVRVHTDGASSGRTEPIDGESTTTKKIFVARPIATKSFYDLVLKSFL